MSLIIQPKLNEPQGRFLAMPQKYRAFVGGFGSGKTFGGVSGMMAHFWENPSIPSGYFAPTYAQIRDIFYPSVEEVAYAWGFDVRIRETNKEVDVYRGSRNYGTVICRSMEKPETIIGFSIGHALVDEIDVMKLRKAQTAWRKIIARMRIKQAGLANRVDVATTPEGFNFVYGQFQKQVEADPEKAKFYGIVHASTYDNEANLPDDYIDSLRATYPPQLIEAYIEGLFVNLTHGSVYRSFNRKQNNTAVRPESDEPLHVGMDFNVGKMAAVVHVIRDGKVYAVDEVVNAFDTPDIIEVLRERYWVYRKDRFTRTRPIIVYPDSSGGSRDTNNASTTDIQLLQKAGFRVDSPKENPPVKDRINSMNGMFCNAAKDRKYFVNAEACPTYTLCLEQQAYDDNGAPDKKSGLDHHPDGAGYFIHRRFPVVKPKFGQREFLR